MAKDKVQFLSPLFLKYQSDYEKNPRSKVFAPLAEAYRKIGMTDKAMEILSNGIKYNPGYVMGYLGMSACYYDVKQFNMAYTTLRPFVETSRDNLRLQRLFADTCLALGRKDEALETFKYLLFINPKDKEVGKFVSVLENEIESRTKFEHKPIVIPPESFTDFSNLEEVNLNDNAIEKIDFEKWLTVDLSKNKVESKKEESFDKWVLEKEVKPFVKAKEEPQEYKIHQTVEKTNTESSPFVTHTLVDLYIGQGHIEKALNVLEKILELNPSDKSSRDKLAEIKSLIEQPQSSEKEIIIIQEQTLKATDDFIEDPIYAIDEKSLEKVNLSDLESSEEEGRRNLMSLIEEKFHEEDAGAPTVSNKKEKIISKLNLFLAKIRARSLDYQI